MPREPRRAVRPVAAWLAAALAAVAVASWGVALVGRSVTDPRPAPLTAAQVEERLDAATTTTPPAPATTGEVGASTTVAPDQAVPGAPVVPPTSTTAPPAVSPPATPAPPSPTPAPTAVPPAPAGETRTYQLVGGTVSLRFEAAGVTVLFANPAPGFEAEQGSEHGNGVRVEFESETHRSRVTGWWEGGPHDEVDEQADGD